MNETADGRAMRRWFTIGVVLVALWAVVMTVAPLRGALAWAAFLAFLLQPLQRKLTRRLGDKPNLAAGILVALTPLAIFAPIVLLGIAFAQQVAALGGALQSHSSLLSFDTWQNAQAHPRVAMVANLLQERFNVSTDQVREYLVSGLQTGGKAVAAASGQIFINAAGTFLNFFLMLFILFFTLRDGPLWFKRVTKLLPLQPQRREALFDRLGKVTRAVFYGCGLTAAVQGVLVGIGFAVSGLPGSVVFGVLAGLFALLPFGGAALVWVPGALYLLFTGQVGWGIFMLVWGGIVSVSDNFIRPIIISRYTPVPTLLVFLGVIGGVSAFGAIGFVFGPVILVLATELLRFAEGSIKTPD